MLFSIIIPAYNASGHIRKALDSIKQQKFKDYELIVICDSCDDNTEEIAREYGAITEKVNFHCDGPTRSRGIDIAKGDYLLFMDDDDWWLHEYVLTQLAEKVRELRFPDVLCFSFIFKHWMYATPYRDAAHKIRWIATWNKCWKRSFVAETRFPHVEFCSDKYFNDCMMAKGGKWVDWDMPMYYYNYKRKGSQTALKEGDIEEED